MKELEEFTFRGIPSAVTERLSSPDVPCPVDDIKEKMRMQREKQRDLITQLKSQLEELEVYAYETGEAGLPQSVLLDRHKLVIGKKQFNIQTMNRIRILIYNNCHFHLIDQFNWFTEQLRDRLNLNVDELEKLSDDDLKFQVDQAISEVRNCQVKSN